MFLSIAFATDIHGDDTIFEWTRTVSKHDITIIGGDVGEPDVQMGRFQSNALECSLVRDTTRNRLLQLASGSRKPLVVVLGNHDNPDKRALHGSARATG